MLFDIRGRRRNVVKVVYLGLALLLGGGLVLFGIGGDVQGGLVDALNGGGNNANDQLEERRDDARAATRRDPRNARNFAVLAQAEFQLAGQSEGYNPNDQENPFQGASRTRLEAAKGAWDRHLQLAGDSPNVNAAGTMKNALSALGDDAGAVRAQEIVLDSLPNPGFGDYAQLAFFAYQAGQTRKGDLASERAQDLAPRDQREALKAQLDQAKTQAATAGASTTPTPAPTTAPGG